MASGSPRTPKFPKYAFDWVNVKQALRPWQTKAEQFKQMSSPSVVFDAAKAAGEVLKTSMQDMIYAQPSLDSYADVAERLQVWGESGDNVWVGIHPHDSVARVVTLGRTLMVDRAWEMDHVFPVIHSVVDLERQTHQVEQVFETNLVSKVF